MVRIVYGFYWEIMKFEGMDVILVVMDIFSKYGYFLNLKYLFIMLIVVVVFVKEIV